MKKILLGSLLLSAALFLSSCVRDGIKNAYSPGSVTPSIVSMNGAASFDIPTMVTDTTITLSSNVWWSLHSADQAPWCDYSLDDGTTDGTHMGYTPMHFTLVPNITDQDRVFSFTVKAEDPVGYTQTFVLTQKCTLEKFAVSEQIKRRIDPSIDAVMMPKLQGSLPFDLTTNSDWKIVTSDSWCQVMGVDTGQPGVDIPVEIACASNPTEDYRHATVQIMTADDHVLMEFKIIQSGTFNAPVVTIVNNAQKLSASWTPTDGVSGYAVIIYDSQHTELTQIPVSSNVLELDMTDFAAATGLADYVGQIEIAVRALTPDPAIYAESETVLSNSHFADNGGDGASASSRFRIANSRHLANLSKAYPKGFFYYLLDYNVDLSGQPMPGIGTATAPFVGDFDGGSLGGRTIANSLYEFATADANASSSSNYGFFAVAGNQGANVSKIANMTFKDCTLTLPNFSAVGRSWALCVGLNNGATISNVTMINCSIAFNVRPAGAKSAANIGMIAGTQTGGRLTKCSTTGGQIGRINEVFAADNNTLLLSIGGIAGLAGGGAVVDSCANVSTPVGSYLTGGGIVGTFDASVPAQIIQCYNKAAVTASSGAGNTGGVGGIIGTVTASAVNELLVDRCWNSGAVGYLPSGGPSKMGGIIGGSQVASFVLTMKQCFNSGDVYYYYPSGGNAITQRVINVGGLGGMLVQNGGTNTKCCISDCYNSGNVTLRISGMSGAATFALAADGTGVNAGVGGLAGWVGGNGTDRGYIQNSYNSGAVTVLLEGADPGTTNCLGNLLGRSNNNGTPGAAQQQPLYNTVYVANAFIGDSPVSAVIGSGTQLPTFTTGFHEFSDLSSQAAFEALGDSGKSYDFVNVWDMGAGHPILRGLYGNPAQ